MTGPSGGTGTGSTRFSRRRLLGLGIGGAAVVAGAGGIGFELVSHGVLPGKQELDQLDGACTVASPPLVFSPRLGPSHSGTFYSSSRRTNVGYTIAYPPTRLTTRPAPCSPWS